MADRAWNSATGGNFATGSAWAGGVKPGPSDNAILGASGAAFTVTSSVNEIVTSIQMVATATLDVTGGHFSAAQGSGAGANAGVIEVGGTGWFHSGGTLKNSGSVEAMAGGRIALAGEVQNAGGTINAAGGSVWLEGVDVVGGTLASSTGHDLLVTKGGELDGTGAAGITLTGMLVIADGRSEGAAGTLVNKGRIGLAHKGEGTTDLAVAAAGLTLSGGGTVVLTGSSTRIDAATTGQLTNVDNRIVAVGTIGNAGLTLTNEAAGFITSGAGGALVIDTGSNILTNAGKIEGRTGGTTIMGAVDNTGALIAIGGDLTVDGAVTGAGQASIFGGTLTFGGSFNEDVRFNENTKYGRTGGELVLADSVHYSGSISGFSTTSATTLDLRDIAFTSGTTKATYSGTSASGTLTVTDGTHTATIKLIGDFTGSTWTVASDGRGGTTIVDPPAPTGPSLAALTSQLAAFAPGQGTMSSMFAPTATASALTLAGPI